MVTNWRNSRPHLFPGQRVETDVLPPVGHTEDIAVTPGRRGVTGIPRQSPDRALRPARPFDPHLLLAGLSADGDDAVAQAEGEVLPVVGPGAAVHSMGG